MTEFVLKRDTPFYKKGTRFSEDSLHRGVILNDDCLPVANLNELDDPGEWFDTVDDSKSSDDYVCHIITIKRKDVEEMTSKQYEVCKAQLGMIRELLKLIVKGGLK